MKYSLFYHETLFIQNVFLLLHQIANSMEQIPWKDNCSVTAEIPLPFMEQKGTLPHPWESATGTNPEPDKSSPQPLATFFYNPFYILPSFKWLFSF